MNMFDVMGKKAIITGSSRGLGFAMAEALCEAGAEVVMMDINPGITHMAKSIAGKAHGIVCDLLDRPMRKKCFDRAMELLGGEINILINNAGIQHRGSILDYPDTIWDQIIELNLNAVFSLCKYAGAYMVPQRSGKIINIVSMNSFFGGTNVPPYAASKGALVQFTKAIANEWGKYGINANAIAPGFMKTEMTMDIQENSDIYEGKLERIPMGRWGEPEDLKGIVLFLCSAASNYICGAIIPVDGGYLCK